MKDLAPLTIKIRRIEFTTRLLSLLSIVLVAWILLLNHEIIKNPEAATPGQVHNN